MELTTVIFYLPSLLVFMVLAVYGERKVSAFIQDRYGPMETGKYGLLQTIADLLKLIQKEDIVSRNSQKFLFRLAPIAIFIFVFTGFSFLPVNAAWTGATVPTGLYFLLALISLDVIGIILAGWASNNKYSLIGSMRSAAQMISYEVPLTLALVSVVMFSQSLDLQEISYQQSIFTETENYFLGISIPALNVTEAGGILSWNVFRMPLLFVSFIIFFIASLAECNRAPFDLPEAESELVAGYQTEYGGFRWAVVMLSEYGLMLLVSILAVVLFFGSWSSPLPNIGAVKLYSWTTGVPGTVFGFIMGAFWITVKAWSLILLQMWVRWTYPRLRIDQLMALSWKVLTPAALIIILLVGIWRLLMI